MSYTVTITTALGRTLSRSVATLGEVRHAINSTHLARHVSVIDDTTGESWSPQDIDALLDEDMLV
jgi:hypothetical protein